ncbi:MAG: mechanosensitive ion channel family protein [bacterium]
MIEWLKLHGIRMSIIIFIGVIVYIMIQYSVPRFIKRTMLVRMKGKLGIEREKRTRTLSRVMRNTFSILVGIVILFTILAQIGVNIGPALASLGVLGVAVGFGAQSLIKDVINGIFILMENQFGIGDVVKIGNVSGLVEEVNLRRTILRDLDGVVHYIPNSEIVIASNYTKEYSRVNLNISVSYGSDLDRVIKVINDVCNKLSKEKTWQDKIIKKPQVLRVDKFGDSGIEIKIMGDTTPLAQWEIMGELRKRLKKEFDEKSIEIPYPHMKVYFGSDIPSKQP